MAAFRRGGRVVDCGGLENRWGYPPPRVRIPASPRFQQPRINKIHALLNSLKQKEAIFQQCHAAAKKETHVDWLDVYSLTRNHAQTQLMSFSDQIMDYSLSIYWACEELSSQSQVGFMGNIKNFFGLFTHSPLSDDGSLNSNTDDAKQDDQASQTTNLISY